LIPAAYSLRPQVSSLIVKPLWFLGQAGALRREAAGREKVPGARLSDLPPTVSSLPPEMAGEAGGEVAAAVELLDDGDGVGAEGAVDRAVDGLVAGEEGLSGVVDDGP